MNIELDYKKEFEEHAIKWGEAIIAGDHRTANRHNSAITKIAKNFNKDRYLGEMVLMSLLEHPNPSVRLFSSVHALDLGFHIKEAEDVITQVADDPNIHVVQLMAKINLAKWNQKKNMNST